MISGIIYVPIVVPLFFLFLALAQPLSATFISIVDMATVLVPSAALVVGAAVAKPEWLPYAVAIAALLTGIKFLMGGSSDQVQHAVDAAKAKATGTKQDPALKGAALQEKTINNGVLNSSEFQNFELKDKKVISHNTAVYRFALPKATDVLGLPTGQHISLAATPTGAEKEVVRSYTPVSSDELDKGYFDLLVKAYPQGNISRHLSELKFGDTMKVKGPKGAMVYTPNMCRHIGMVAGGTGITPMLQIARAINRGRAAGDKTEVDLIFANVNEEDILVREELDKLAKTDSRFRVHYVLNNPPANWMGGVGFVTSDMIKKSLPAPADDIKILVCGPPPMVSAIKKATESLGYTKARPVSKLVDQVFCF